jgi:hypothetical protein
LPETRSGMIAPQMIDDPGRMHERLMPRMQIWALPATPVRRRSRRNTIS